MTTLSLCRVCLSRNIRMHIIANTPYQKIFEELSGFMLITKDGKPVTLCYICFALLQKCRQFKEISRKTNKLFNKILNDGIKIAQDKTMNVENPYNLCMSTTKCVSLPEYIKNEKPEVKKEITGEKTFNEVQNDGDSVIPIHCDVRLTTNTLKQELGLSEIDGDSLDISCISAINEFETTSKSCNNTILSKTRKHTTKSLNMGSTDKRKMSYACDICNKLFKQNINLKRHMKTHKDTKFACKNCSETFNNKYDYQNHNALHTRLLYTCDMCVKSFSSKYSLKIHITEKHMKTHTKIHNCDQCNKSFNHRGTLRLHMRTHTGDKPYACEQCSKCFSQRVTLQRHMRIHTGERPYACDKCTKTFNQTSSLNRHIRMHTGDRSFACSRCDKAYYESSHLTRHLRTHTGEKPYACDRCFQTFSQSGNLQAHMRKHTGEKTTNYICYECNKTFYHKSIFKRHLLKHTQEKPYPCDRCDKKYADKRTLQRHIVTHSMND